jgi:hypothetical protein
MIDRPYKDIIPRLWVIEELKKNIMRIKIFVC